ncbi:MAG: patatin-like phospholipase family protein, partial [Ahrensia sp.]|nr:patatin-like phospholipase family protein [Ahrensia sp.]
MSVIEKKKTSGDPTVAVAFGGGGARGYAHIHIIEVLDEMGVKPVAISGASIGSIMGAAMASGMKGVDVREFSLELAGNKTDVLTRFLRSRTGGIANLFSGEYSIGQLDALSILKEFLPKDIKADFADLNIPMSISATDYYGYSEKIFNQGDLFLAMAASASIPAVFRPVKCDGRYMVDGGIFNPV